MRLWRGIGLGWPWRTLRLIWACKSRVSKNQFACCCFAWAAGTFMRKFSAWWLRGWQDLCYHGWAQRLHLGSRERRSWYNSRRSRFLRRFVAYSSPAVGLWATWWYGMSWDPSQHLCTNAMWFFHRRKKAYMELLHHNSRLSALGELVDSIPVYIKSLTL